MLRPTKYLDLELSVLNVSSKILKILREENVMKYDELLNYLKNSISDEVDKIFTHSLSFLFLLGKIEYLNKIDAISLTE